MKHEQWNNEFESGLAWENRLEGYSLFTLPRAEYFTLRAVPCPSPTSPIKKTQTLNRNIKYPNPQKDLQAKVYMHLVWDQDSCSIGKSSIGKLFEGKGDFVTANTVLFFFYENQEI